MKSRIFAALLAPAFAFGLAACTVEQTEEGEAPEVDPGELPEYDVQPADVDVNWDTTTIRTPDIDINPDTVPPDTTPGA
jgi:hypothetical protein